MAIKTVHNSTHSIYFVTFTCAEWIPLFEITQCYDCVYQWFDILKEKHRASVIAYVIMPNHLHVLLHFPTENFQLNRIVGNAKRFMAYAIINRLQKSHCTDLLQRLSGLLTERERKKGQLHKVFKDSFDAKPVFTQAFLLQKINYIHKNPVNGKWNLVRDLASYEHSSAGFYEQQTPRHFIPTHFMDC
jgi:putative transposase